MSASYSIRARWAADGLSAKQIGTSLLDLIEQLSAVAPDTSPWVVPDFVNEQYVEVSRAAPRITQFVSSGLQMSDFGGPSLDGGYKTGATTLHPDERPSGKTVNIYLWAGSRADNSIEFKIGDLPYPSDFSLITYPIYRGALEAIASALPCPWVAACAYHTAPAPVDSPQRGMVRRESVFTQTWIAYLAADLANGLTPPPEFISERTPGGGVILSALETVIDQSNPEHMRRSRLLEKIMLERVGLGPGRLARALPARVGPY